MRVVGMIFVLALTGPAAAEEKVDLRTACQNLAAPAAAEAACVSVVERGAPGASRYAWAWNNLGLAHAAQGAYLSALEAYAKALSADPRFAPALSNRGNAHAALGDMLAAKADHEAAVALDPEYVAARHNLAVDLEEMGEYRAALTAYRAVLAQDPAHKGARVGLATASCKLGRIKSSAEARVSAITRGALDASQMQVLLQSVGFYKGPIDGIFGKGSRAALWAWTRAGCLPRA
ncbi:MAG: tetratricopeptide repeat protein [Paracoccaceae bacterium]